MFRNRQVTTSTPEPALWRCGFGIQIVGSGSRNRVRFRRLTISKRPSPERARSFSEIRITGGTVHLYDAAQKIVETLTNVEFALAWPAISKSFAATGRFAWHDQPIDATLSLTDFVAALTGDRSGLKLRLSGALLKLAYDGSISHRPILKLEGALSADERKRLMEIADKCPVHRTLESEIDIRTFERPA